MNALSPKDSASTLAPSSIRLTLAIVICAQLLAVGCSRNHYRLRADRETYNTLAEKTASAPWTIPAWFTIDPHPDSRYATQTNPNDPELPPAAPQLYAYHLPEMPERDPSRFRGGDGAMLQPMREEELIARLMPQPRRPAAMRIDHHIRRAAYLQPEELPLNDAAGRKVGSDQTDESEGGSPYASSIENELVIVKIPEEVWQSLPKKCLGRMLEFESVREEYERTFNAPPSLAAAESGQKLSLEDIVDVAIINSRDYQRQKEILYLAALNLTLERFAYDLKFDPFGNGSEPEFLHDRAAGLTDDTLTIPSRFNGGKLLATGGELVAGFANRVVLTFNGPAGYASEVNSELLLRLSQTIFQRDFVLENLTQAEREVVYAAREFARFRKTFFQDRAGQYYDLLLRYRGIEIDAQAYFSNLRAFNQGQAEFAAGSLPRVQVDQFEQDALRARSSLINQCNTLERDLDSLKFAMGIPPELPLNLDLTELELLTLRDETTVSAELVRRARRSLRSERQSDNPDRVSLLNYSIDLTRRLLNLEQLRARLGEPASERSGLELALTDFLVDESRILVEENRAILVAERAAEPSAPPLRIFQRTVDLIGSELRLLNTYLDFSVRSGIGLDRERYQRQMDMLESQVTELRDDLLETVKERELQQLPQLVVKAEDILRETTALLDEAAPKMFDNTPQQDLERIIAKVDRLLATSNRAITQKTAGLVPIEIEADDAMLTALSQRFDVMNERGRLADDWRQIKFAADFLKSILDVSVDQRVRTDSTKNNPFDFTFDDSTTTLTATFDAPLNRKAERNAFRATLINYQFGLRNLIALEDSIKQTIRDDLRNLQLDREQYDIAVASAALAYERVLSTRLQLQLGVEDVAARDFLEAQQAYTESLSAVAGEHIGYITDRIALFVDTELMQLDDSGFWPALYNESLQPEVNIAPPCADGPYGQLPDRVWHTRKIRRMLQVPYGQPLLFNAEEPEFDTPQPNATPEVELLPIPEE